MSNYLTLIDFKNFDSLGSIQSKIAVSSAKETVQGTLLEIINRIPSINIAQTNLNGILSNITKDIFTEHGLNDDSVEYFRFRVNPIKESMSRKKMMSSVYTGGGWDNDIRAEEMIPFSFQCTTGSLVPLNLVPSFSKYIPEILKYIPQHPLPYVNSTGSYILNSTDKQFNVQSLLNNWKLSNGYLKYLVFEKFWEKNNDDILFIWEDDAYVGKLVNLRRDLDANNPYQIFFTFDIIVYPEFKYNLYTGWINNAEFRKIKEKFNNYKITKGLFSPAESLSNKVKRVKRDTGGTMPPIPDVNSLEAVDITGNGGLRRGIDLIPDPNNPIAYPKTTIASLSPDEQADEQWFIENGDLLYNKDKLKFLKVQNKNFESNISKITPETISTYYRNTGGQAIDVFEDSKTFNLKSVITVNEGRNATQTKSNSNDELVLEKASQGNIL